MNPQNEEWTTVAPPIRRAMLMECIFLSVSVAVISALTAVNLLVGGAGTPLLALLLAACLLYAPFWIQRRYRRYVSNAVTIRWNDEWIEFKATPGNTRRIAWREVAKVDFNQDLLVTNEGEHFHIRMFLHRRYSGISCQIMRSSNVPEEVREALHASKEFAKAPLSAKIVVWTSFGLALAIPAMEIAKVISKPVAGAGLVAVSLLLVLFPFFLSRFLPDKQIEVAVNRKATTNE